MDGADHLAALLDQLIVGEALHAQTREWLLNGVMAYIRTSDENLDRCLGLAVAGKPRLHTRLQRAKRNEALRQALKNIALDENVQPWQRCQRLAEQAKRLVPIWERQYRMIEEPPQDWPQWRVALFQAWRTGQTVPESPRGLYNVLNETKGFFVQ